MAKKKGPAAPVEAPEVVEAEVVQDEQETQIIRVIGLPEIIEQMELISAKFKSAVDMVQAMDVTEESLVVARDTRADIRKAFDMVDSQRKAAKNQYAAPWNAFEQRYKELIYDAYLEADQTIKGKIGAVEEGVRQKKLEALTRYFKEYADAQNVLGIKLDAANIKVNYGSSLTALKKQAKEFVDRVGGELAAIAVLPDADEIISEYERDYNMSRAVSVVSARHAAIEKAKKEREEREEAERQRQEHVAQVEAAVTEQQRTEYQDKMGAMMESAVVIDVTPEELTPVAEPEVYEAVFAVIDTMDAIREVKQFMKERGIHYESR